MPVLIQTIGLKKTKPAFQPHAIHTSAYYNNNVILVGKARIKFNARFSNFVVVTSEYVETFTFLENCLYVNIYNFQNLTKKITIIANAYTKLATKFLYNNS